MTDLAHPDAPIVPDPAAMMAVASPFAPDAIQPAGDLGALGDQSAERDAREDAIEAFAALVADTHLRRQRWDLALQAERRNDPAACLADCLAVLELEPGHREARLLGASSARELRDWDCAAELLGGLVDDDEPAGELDWDRIVAATIAGDHAGVSASCHRLGLDPADWTHAEAFVFIVLDGRPLVARRIGAASAEILSIATGERPQHVGDVVAFDPRPPAGQANGRDLTWQTFRALAIVASGRRQVWVARGGDPGFAAWEDAVGLLAQRGWVLRRTLTLPGEPTGDLGVVAIDAGVDADEVFKGLSEATADWPSPVAWRS